MFSKLLMPSTLLDEVLIFFMLDDIKGCSCVFPGFSGDNRGTWCVKFFRSLSCIAGKPRSNCGASSRILLSPRPRPPRPRPPRFIPPRIDWLLVPPSRSSSVVESESVLVEAEVFLDLFFFLLLAALLKPSAAVEAGLVTLLDGLLDVSS